MKREETRRMRENQATQVWMSVRKKKEQAEFLKDEKPKYYHKMPRKMDKNEKALVAKEMGLSNLGKNILIGDSAATSHMTSNKMGVYSLILINGSVMIGNGQSII